MIKIHDFSESSLTGIVYDHGDERLVNNANAERDYVVHVQCPDMVVERARSNALLVRVPKEHFLTMTRVVEKLFDVINCAPNFSSEVELFSFSSFGQMGSDGSYRFRLELENSEDAKSFVYETPSSADVSPEDLEEVAPETTEGRRIDAVLQILVAVDEEHSEVSFSAVAEEVRLCPRDPPATAPKKSRRRPVLLSA